MKGGTSVALAAMVALAWACTKEPAFRDEVTAGGESTMDVSPGTTALAMFAVLPDTITAPDRPLTAARVSLGRTLYYETVLSDGHDVSCNTCHPLNGWGADGRPVSLGHEGRAGTRNAPTVYQAAGHFAQFWDGRARDVEEQATGPILNPVEMAMPESAAVLKHLRDSKAYQAAFRAAFPGEAAPITYRNVGIAIGAFERGLVTPSAWDKYLTGDSTSLTPEEQRGLRTFVASGCQACHNGPYLGGGVFQKVGLVTPWPSQADSGRYNLTRDAADLLVFKVPSLRNIAKTGPYFHDGSVADLSEAVQLMSRHQLGRELPKDDVTAIVTFANAFTGTIPTDYIAQPPRPK